MNNEILIDGQAQVIFNKVPSDLNRLVHGYFFADPVSSGKTMDIELNYNGEGFPMAVMIFPMIGTKDALTRGTNYTGSMPVYFMSKYTFGTPDYQQNQEQNFATSLRWERVGGSWSEQGLLNSLVYSSDVGNAPVMFTSSTVMRVYINKTGSGGGVYGFVPNTQYEFIVVYSE